MLIAHLSQSRVRNTGVLLSLFLLTGVLSLPLRADDKTVFLSETGVGPGVSETLAYEGTTVYIARHDKGVDVMSVVDPYHPVKLTTIDPDGPNFATTDVWDVQVLNNVLYVFNRGKAADPNPGKGNFTGVYMYDVSNPQAPVELGAITYGKRPNYHLGSTTQSGEVGLISGVPHLFVCSYMSGCVEIFNVSNPALAVWKSTVRRVSRGAKETVYQNGMLYTAWGTDGFTVHNVSNPALPVRTNRQVYTGPFTPQPEQGVRTLWPTPDGLHVVTGEYTTTSVVRKWAVNTQAGTTAEVATWRLGSKAYLWSVKATNNYAYVAHLEDGIRILDLSQGLASAGSFDPDPALAIRTWDGIADIALNGSTMYASHEQRGLFIVNHDPNQDTVTVSTATYQSSTNQLTIYATSTQQPNPTLTVTGLGAMTWNATNSRYELIVTVPSAPVSVSVTSSAGSSAIKTVQTVP